MKDEWIPVGKNWPPEYRMVLVATDQFEASAPAINVGYMKLADVAPYFVCPGAQRGFKPLFWCDCLGDDFAPPNWKMKQPLQDGEQPESEYQAFLRRLSKVTDPQFQKELPQVVRDGFVNLQLPEIQ
jgi:hypothetical protein